LYDNRKFGLKPMSAPFNPVSGRRQFLKAVGGSAAAIAMPSFGVEGANDQIRLGLIGCGGRGTSLFDWFRGISGVKFVALSDADTAAMDRIASKHQGLAKHQDYRKLLEREDIDAVVIATPNHWHALQVIHACQAGKDVYVEKPVTFSVDQGRAIIEARDKYQRIVQAGTQNRSDKGLINAFEYIRSGEIGKIKAVRGLCYRNRASIGKLDKPLKIPASVDYNLWLGGCKDVPIMRPQLHYDWHWDFNTGNGDVGNQAPHEFDLISWVLGDPLPTKPVRSFGNRFGWNDAGDTANMQTVWYELGGVPVIFEVNNMTLKPKLDASPAFKGLRVGVIVTCEGGEFIGGRGGGFVNGEDGKTKIERFPGDAGGGHARNFIEAVRSRKGDGLRAKLENSVASATVPHLANLSYRAGEPVPRTKLREALGAELADVIDRQEKQMGFWGIDTEKTPYLLGPEVTLGADGRVSGSPAVVELATPKYREGFGIPASV
jgi:predicted dehydrogenase